MVGLEENLDCSRFYGGILDVEISQTKVSHASIGSIKGFTPLDLRRTVS